MTTLEKSTSNNNDLSKIRHWMQFILVLLTIMIGLRHILPGESSKGGAFDAFCPFGAIETLWVYLSTGHTLITTNLLNFSALLAVLGVSLITGRSFCGWICPLGTIQDWFTKWARWHSGEKNRRHEAGEKTRFPIQVQERFDRWLRFLKYLVLVIILAASTKSIYPPLYNICPARAFFSFHWDTWLLPVVLFLFVITSILIQRFSCKYLCPLGAALAIFNKVSPIYIAANPEHCTHCERCEAECPVDIPAIPENTRSAECIRCLDCIETCSQPDTIELRIG